MTDHPYLSSFKKQLHFPAHELKVLSGFAGYLINQDKPGSHSCPYGLLVQYDDEALKNIFIQAVDDLLIDLPTRKKYCLKGISAKNFSTMTFRKCGINSASGDIFILLDCDGITSTDHLVQEFENHPEIIKIVCASSESVETLLRNDPHLYHRLLPRHIHVAPLDALEIADHFMEQLDREGYHYSDGFKEELTYYIDTIYDSADFKDVAFISDLMRRIVLQMEENEGSNAYKDNAVIDESFVPYSQKVQIRRSQEEPVKTSAPVETSTQMQLEDLFCDKSPCSRADFFTESESGKNAGIFLVLSAYNPRSICSDYNVVSDSFTVSEDTCTYKGIQTNDAPVQHLIDEVYRSGYNLKKIVCITTPKVLDSIAGDGISNYERFQNLAEKYAESVWNETGIEITNIVYNNETDSPDYDKFYKDLNEESGNLDAFFVDYTGGLRDMSFLMVVAIRFLEFKNIECKKVIYSDFFSNPKKIKCLDSVYNLFQMINGMNEFVSSGTTRQLDDIFQKENPLILAIRNFSHATNVGDMAHIDEFVHKLAEELEKNTASGNLKDIMISSMNEIIRKKIFGVSENLSLIENGRIDYCRLIEWCIENKMYQQAATLYIEKIPVVYWQDGIITDLVKLSSNTTMPDSSEVTTFYTDLPAQLFSTTEKTVRDLLKNVVPPGRNKWNHNEFIKELKRTLVHYPDICQRLTDIITTYYKNFDRKTGSCSIEKFDIQIEEKNIRTFMNNISEAIYSDIFYYLIHGNLDGYAGRKKSKGSEKTRLLHNLIAFWDLKDAFPKTSNDALLCRLLAFYLAIKILRNKMSHAAENIVSSDMELTDSLEKFLNEIEETDDIKISLSENDIHMLLIRAMKYSREAKKAPFKKFKLVD
ncbi:TM1812 family CRISPR-associated protein [uncultured Eubacterium sp.]|mgnify:CR=1 FL=1|uniref:TM1812 family CRISPR-associated protein n=1 Tax=uncultured Eubacterium sp. TaxID=165185 RepID=UPI0025E8F92A|nr:TM1812 family CRISPR-associated protein [uncultured Eubacterium sp.]